ncbi:MBL fold metallo-hydrolase [Thalassobacillus hwangdonensis]|uniref:MBL fold metallo-hydrolase n=1 Tax=Thalassobacillus hwangdonensis TaxID=546108 RepID=A0ABW3L4E0_9BACI
MDKYICSTCGIQYGESEEVPQQCSICNEERQYVHPDGQQWTTLNSMIESGTFKNEIIKEEENVYSITTTPRFGIGQTAYLIIGEGFNVLWDCVTYLDEETIRVIESLGGIDAIALSHPHYYSTQAKWAETFRAPIYIHNDDRNWVMESYEGIRFWEDETLKLSDELSLHRLGGHFKGGAVMHLEKSDGILFTGDIIQVVAHKGWVGFMYSYPNLIPLPSSKVEDIAGRIRQLEFNRLYNAFHRVIETNASEAVQKSAERYIDAIEGRLFST